MKLLCVVAFCATVLVSFAQAQVAPTIASVSNSTRVNEGESLSLTVSVNGTAPFTYVWKKGATTISSATTNTFTIAAVAVSDAGSYTVTISNASGSVTSGAILIDVTPATAPSFYYQPSTATYTVGDTINLSANVSGTQPMTFVWKKDGTTVASGSNSYFNKANAQTGDSGSYTVTATNAAGSATSQAIVVTVNPLTAPVFTSQPSSTTVDPGNYVSFYAWVANSTGVTFQWYKDDVAIPNATSSNFWISSATATNAGNYKVVATNAAGSTTSNVAKLTVNPASAPTNLTITTGPLSVATGDSLSLYSSFSGTGPFTYQWKKDGADIPGATSSSYYKSNAAAEDAGIYSLVVTNAVGSATSAGTSVSVSSAQVPIILTHPTSQTVYPGDYISIGVNASGTGTLTYQWKKDGVIISGQTSSYFYISNSAAASDAGTFTVTVSNSQGATTSQPATITVLPPVAPTISLQPAGMSLQPGQQIILSVGATGHPQPTYQWKKDGTDIPGATSNNYLKSNIATSDSGSYTVVVSNVAGSVTSSSATVSVSAATAPVIVRHPASASLLLGDSFYDLSVLYDQYGSTVQWYRDNVAISGATDSTNYIWGAQPSMAGTYKAVVTNSVGSATTLDAVITVDLSTSRPVIVYTSGSQAVTGGSNASAFIYVSPSVTSYTVLWKKDGVVVPNANSLYLNLYNFGPSAVGSYTAEVTTGGSTYTSRPVVLSLYDSGTAPRITTQPATRTVAVGEWTGFTVMAAGEGPLSYQWKKDGVDIPNATSASYTFYPTTTSSAGGYSVVITNRNGSTTSSVATLTVSSPSAAPIISGQPTSQTYTSGSSYLYVSVGVLNPVDGQTYQWYKDDVAISGATGSSYSSGSTVTTASGGRYKVKVTNSVGSTMSAEAVITVINRSTGPTFTTQPSNQTAYTGGSVTFTATATGNSTISYQWRKNGTAISGATSSSLTLNNLQSSDAGNYSVLASNADGSTASAIAQLTVAASIPPSITSQPTSQVGGKGGSASFSVSATGTPAPTYQWKKNGADISGATSSTLSWSSLATADGGNYSVVVTNSGGSVTSNVVSLTVYDQQPYAPTITNQPQSRAYALGESVTLTVGAGGLPTPTIQWYKNGTPVGGGNSETLSLGKMTNDLAGDYHAIATNVLGSASSNVAKITVAIDTERLVNVSTRASAGKDANTLIAGFVISGNTPKNVLIRAVGPSLVPLGVTNVLANPQLKLFKQQDPILSNDDWSTGNSTAEIIATANRLGAFALDAGSRDAVILTQLNPGVYTAHVTTSDASSGTALLEVYDADASVSSTKVVNLSSRGAVGAGDDILIVGFVITGNVPKKVLVRGVGPALAARGVTGALADPKLLLFRGQTQIGENDNWSSGSDTAQLVNAATVTGATSLDVGSKDAAMLITLAPGLYTAHVRGVGNTTGVALIEVYDVP